MFYGYPIPEEPTTEEVQRAEYAHQRRGAGSKGELDADTIAELSRIANRETKPAKEPPMSHPEYTPEPSRIEVLYDRVLNFMYQIGFDELKAASNVATPFAKYVLFLGHRIYIVPNVDQGQPDHSYEVWFKGEQEWERCGHFGRPYRAIEHIYVRHVRNVVRPLDKGATP